METEKPEVDVVRQALITLVPIWTPVDKIRSNRDLRHARNRHAHTVLSNHADSLSSDYHCISRLTEFICFALSSEVFFIQIDRVSQRLLSNCSSQRQDCSVSTLLIKARDVLHLINRSQSMTALEKDLNFQENRRSNRSYFRDVLFES